MSTINSRWALLLPAILLSAIGCGEEPVVRTSTPIRINEVNPANPVYQDMVGDTDDWIELYNPTDAEFQLEGYYISDSAGKRFKDQFVAGTVIPAKGVLLVWADAEPEQSSVRAPHTTFKLSSSGEGVWLSNPDGYVIDRVDFGSMPVNPSGGEWTSLARFPDGTGPFSWCTESSADELNGSKCIGQTL
ncbi:MAG TPA: lamin tail domain-containing protein [Polyangiaceae bacterium]